MITRLVKVKKALQLIAIITIGIFMVAFVLAFAHKASQKVYAAGPIPPPVGYPKLTLSSKVVTPTLAETGGAVLEYNIKILNTGAYAASDVTLLDAIPNHTTLKGEVKSSALPKPVVVGGMIQWLHGVVDFDSAVAITYSVKVDPSYAGIITDTAVISDPLIAEPVTVMAETRITDDPLFAVTKSSAPDLPGKNKPLTYELLVTNQGQDAINTPITVTDYVPSDTVFRSVGEDGTVSPESDIVTWTRKVNLEFGETTPFTFSVQVGNVTSGTLIHNGIYYVNSPFGINPGEPITTTVIDPIFILSKSISPDPPGSNSELTYTLTVLNLGSQATNLVITDTVPSGVQYLRGGDGFEDGVVTWQLDSLDTDESAQVSFTVYVADVANIIVLNDDYAVCSAEGVCAPGIATPNLIVGPTFEVTADWDPIAHKPGGGKTYVTPTLTIHNLGPGNALDATALLTFGRVSISTKDVLKVIPSVGTFSEGPPCTVWSKCVNYVWTGDMDVGDVITITTIEGQSTIGGEEWTPYTATVVVTDDLGGYVTEPVTGTVIGHVTHMSNLIPTKTAPLEIGPGQTMTYTIQVFDSGLSTLETPPPVLTDTVPASVTLENISDGGIAETVDGKTVVAWTLPAMSPGDLLYRRFSVKVDQDLVSGTLIVNDDYRTTTYESYLKGFKSILGEPFTTTVHEVGLIDSYKTVTPTWALPAEGTVLTYEVHVANSGPVNLSDVEVSDIFPWEHTTYQRDAVARAGKLVSDIISFDWTGDVGAYSEEVITFTTLVDDFYEGVVTNTATISHTSLQEPVVITAVAYITDDPVLRIAKVDSPDPVLVDTPLLYQVEVSNLGQQATLLVVTDTIPDNTSYIYGSASSGGQLMGDQVQWKLPVLKPGESTKVTFQVLVQGGYVITNDSYSVRCDEGAVAHGDAVITHVKYLTRKIMLPVITKN